MYVYCVVIKFVAYLHCSNNVNTNHSISGGKLWQLLIVGKDVFVIVHDINCIAIKLKYKCMHFEY